MNEYRTGQTTLTRLVVVAENSEPAAVDEMTGEPSSRADRAAAMRSRLLDAAEDLYAAEGAAGLTNRRIGEQADTTTQAIYTYFGSRDALLDAMYRRAITGVEEIIALAAASAPDDPTVPDVADALKQAARNYREFCLQHPARLRMIRKAAGDVDAPPAAAELRNRLVDAVALFGRTGGGQQTSQYVPRIHLTLAAIHGFIEAELDGFITADQDPSQLFDELVHRCILPFELVADLYDQA